MKSRALILSAVGASLLGGALLIVACKTEPAPSPDEPVLTSPPEGVPAPPAATAFPVPRAMTHSAKSPSAVPASPDAERALVELQKVCQTHGGDPENPWAIAHGLLAFGPEMTLSNGEPAVDYLYTRYAEISEISGQRLIAFPKERDGVEIEPHTDLVLKAITESGLSPDREVLVAGETFTLADHWEHSLRTSFLNKTTGESSYTTPNDMPWGVQALAAWGTPQQTQWKAFQGTEMDLDDLVKFQAHVLTQESTFMYQAMLAGTGFEKERQGVFNYTCGGAHLVQGSIQPIAAGFGNMQDREKMAAQGTLLAYRYPVEMGVYEQARKQAPSQAMVLYVQQLKFIGHWLESMHKLAATGIYTPSALDQQVMAQAVGDLITTTAALKQLGALDNAAKIRESNNQLYLDIVGDSCHAVRGMELALGKSEVRW